jgi:molecular chaperone HscB
MDHFARLGFPRRHGLDRDALEDAYLKLAQKVHPDRFVGRPSGEQRSAMESSAALNEGYRILRDPVQRAEYLCKLAGIDVDSSDPKAGAPQMGQEFLMEMIERREAVASAQAAGPATLDELRAEVEEELDGAFDEAIEALNADRSHNAATTLVKRRYLQRLIDEIDEIDDSPEP